MSDRAAILRAQAARRARASYERRRAGVMCIVAEVQRPFEDEPGTIRGLIERGYASIESAHDARLLAQDIGELLDDIAAGRVVLTREGARWE